MKWISCLTLIVVALTLLVPSSPVLASSLTETRIESTAKKSHVFKTYLKDDDITVKSKDGIVSLTGTVAEETHKSLAQETVASLPGVRSVDNQLQVKGEPTTENSDRWVSMNVKASLLFHRNLSLSKTDVLVKDGVVTLRGKAASLAQKDLTTEYIKDVTGVKGVQNEMTVPESPGQKTLDQKMEVVAESIDDASITALVKMTLMYHRSTSALHTKVETNQGLVSLAGTARNAAEKDLVTKFVQDVHGVDSVVNNMTIIEAPKS